MKKIKFVVFLGLFLCLFIAIAPQVISAFTFQSVCQQPLTTFSDDSNTFEVSFPPGGGTTCNTIADCPKISLPENAVIFSMKVDMELSNPASEIGTPYIWVPLTSSNQLVQIRTSDGSFVSLFARGVNTKDCTANCDTNSPAPIWTARSPVSNCGANAFSNPSRITTIPGGDVWVADRVGSYVTRLGLVDSAVSTEEYECKGSYFVGANGNPKGITFDVQGNIWVGNNASITNEYRLYKFNKNGTYTWASPHYIDIKNSTYGMIADAYGNVWISSGENNKFDGVMRIDINNCDLSSCPISTTTGFTAGYTPYGIGMDNEGDIWTGDWTGDFVHRIDGGDDGGTLGNVVSNCEVFSPSRTTKSCCTGTAVDKDNNVWTSGHSENKIYVFKNGNCGDIKSVSSVCTNSSGPAGPHGIAIDFDNNAWVVCRHGEVIKYSFDGTNITELKRINLNTGAGSGTGSMASYNYSDMTGLRTIPKNMLVGGTSIPLSTTGTFEVCSDGTTTCSDANICNMVISCATPDESGNCEIPLEIFSMQAGDYTLKNLEVIYGKQTPVTTGGIIPCGRDWDDPSTPLLNETDSCNLCHGIMLINGGMNFLINIAGILGVLALTVVGFLFITSGGNPEKKNNAKAMFKWAIVGFLVIFLSWLIVDFVLSAWGYLDPLGGKWNVVCDL